MIDYQKESMLPIEDADQHFPKVKNKKVHRNVLQRWITTGLIVKGDPNKRRVVLETILIGNRRLTSVEAIRRFVVAQNQPTIEQQPPVMTPNQRRRQGESAAKVLQESGI